MRQRGKRGKGTVYLDNSAGTWVAQVSLGVRDGKRIRRKARAASEAEAQTELERLRRAYHAGADPAKGTLDHYLADWLASHRHAVRASTMTSYAGHVTLHISPLLGGIPVARLRPSDVRRLIEDRLAAGLSPATVGRIITTLRVALNQGVRDRTLLDNAATGVDLPRVEREPVAALTEEGAAAIIEATKDSPIGPLVTLLLGSGLRIGEALGLDWRDVDLERGYVIVRRSKTQVRAVPVSDDAVEALRAQRAVTARYGANEPVFLGVRKRERMRPDSVLHMFHVCLAAAGLPPMRVHDLRHGVATLLVSQGVPMRAISEQLGHRNPWLTAKVYAHVTPDTQRAAVKMLDRKGHSGTG